MDMSLLFSVGFAGALLVAVAGVLYRRRLNALRTRRDRPQLTDEMVRRIEERGRLETEEPLDWEEIREEEERFWKESWDEPDEW